MTMPPSMSRWLMFYCHSCWYDSRVFNWIFNKMQKFLSPSAKPQTINFLFSFSRWKFSSIYARLEIENDISENKKNVELKPIARFYVWILARRLFCNEIVKSIQRWHIEAVHSLQPVGTFVLKGPDESTFFKSTLMNATSESFRPP